jgi:thiamine-phosphate pyrophosphorylase
VAALPKPFLCVITDPALDADRLVRVVEQACEHAPAIQLRRPESTAAELFALAARLRTVTRAHRRTLIVNDRIDVALAVEADGVHLPSAGMDSTRARRLVGSRLLGRSVHSLAEIARERELGAVDYVQFGPVFATASKERYGAPQGLDGLARAIAQSGALPLVAVGGIDAQRMASVLQTGAAGAAVIGAVMNAASPREAARVLTDTVASHARDEQDKRS